MRGRVHRCGLQAVCRSRGFPVKAAGSPKLLENLLLSETGLTAAFEALTRDEVVLLHLLRSHSRPVDLPFFHRVYGAGERTWTRTFTEKYKETFKEVRASLIRRGVLFFADRGEDPLRKKAKLEKLLFLFPQEFHPFLPPLFTEVLKAPGPGEVNDSAVRGKLMELPGTSPGALASAISRRCSGVSTISYRSVEARKEPIVHVLHQAVLNRVVMKVIHVPGKIGFVMDRMFPETALPDEGCIALTSRPAFRRAFRTGSLHKNACRRNLTSVKKYVPPDVSVRRYVAILPPSHGAVGCVLRTIKALPIDPITEFESFPSLRTNRS